MEEKKKKVQEHRQEYLRNYRTSNLRPYNLRFNRKTEADIIAYMDSLDNVQGYIKSLIRANMEAKGITPDTSTVAPQLPPVRPGITYTDPDGTYKVLRVNGNDVMIQDENGKKYATTVEEVEKYLQPLQ